MLYDATVADISAGSNHVGVGEKWRAHVIWPSDAAAPEGELDSDKLMQELEEFLRKQREGGGEKPA